MSEAGKSVGKLLGCQFQPLPLGWCDKDSDPLIGGGGLAARF